MALLRKSDEQIAAKDAEKARKDAEKAAHAFAKSPQGRARAAFEQGDRFFQIDIPHSQFHATSWAVSAQAGKEYKRAPGTDVLGRIEVEGWRLEHANFVYVVLGEQSRDKLLSSGQQVAVAGEVRGIYLFRRADLAQPEGTAS